VASVGQEYVQNLVKLTRTLACNFIAGLSAQLPFELRALEVCLDELASEYDALTTELEATAYPALDSLANKV
jgi:hypothetical protein